MAVGKSGKAELLAAFFDDGVYTSLFSEGAVSAAYGAVNGQSVYVVAQNGDAVDVQDIEKNIKVLELAAQTGNPVVTVYQSAGAKLEAGLKLLKANSELSAAIAKISGVVPQIAVVVGTCAGTSAIHAASADLCIMAQDAELFMTAPFNAEDKVAEAGTAAFAAKAGVAAYVAENAAAAMKKAAEIAGILPGNNLAGPALFDFAAPSKALNLAQYKAEEAVEAIADEGSVTMLYPGYGKHVVTALATVNGAVVGVVATEKGNLCHRCVSKAARFVRMCDAYNIPLVTLVNTDGFGKSEADDMAGGIRQAARLAGVYADATTAKVAVLAGNVIGAVYTVFAAAADWRIALNGSVIAPLAPAAAVSVLYKKDLEATDSIQNATKTTAAAYAAKVCSAQAAVDAGVADTAVAAEEARSAAAQALDMLATKRAVRLAKKHGNVTL